MTTQRLSYLSLILLLMLTISIAGCAEQPAPPPQQSPAVEPYPTQQTPAPTPLQLEYGVRYMVKVVDVVDGDTIDVLLPNGSEERVRMLGVDTPEKSASGNKPNEYDSISDLRYLSQWGIKAERFTTSMLAGRQAYIELDESAGMWGYYGRLLAYVYLENGTDLTAELVRQGYARAYEEGNCKKLDYYLQLEKEAIENRRGLWAYSSDWGRAVVDITDVHYDAGGPHVDDREVLNDEYVVISNSGDTPVNLEGWKLKDKARHTYTFYDVTLQAGATIKVHTGSGADTGTDLYWERSSAVWNNDHDTACLYNEEGELVDSYEW
ncbi:MAG: lamin tail domain-containing protein [Methermicoccaceae archaeon]